MSRTHGLGLALFLTLAVPFACDSTVSRNHSDGSSSEGGMGGSGGGTGGNDGGGMDGKAGSGGSGGKGGSGGTGGSGGSGGTGGSGGSGYPTDCCELQKLYAMTFMTSLDCDPSGTGQCMKSVPICLGSAYGGTCKAFINDAAAKELDKINGAYTANNCYDPSSAGTCTDYMTCMNAMKAYYVGTGTCPYPAITMGTCSASTMKCTKP